MQTLSDVVLYSDCFGPGEVTPIEAMLSETEDLPVELINSFIQIDCQMDFLFVCLSLY